MNIFICGATSGIGLELCKFYLKKRNNVYCLGRNFLQINKFVKKNHLTKFFFKIIFDLKKNFNDNMIKKISNLDKIVICPGFVKDNLIKFFNNKIFDNLIKVNLTNPVKIISNLYSKEKINNNAQIVFVSSLLGSYKFRPGALGYALSKAGIISAVKSLALEFAEKNISVNAVAPAMVETNLIKNLRNISKDQFDVDKKKYILEKKYLSIKEIKDQIIYLLSKKAKKITGQTLVIDAGYLLK